MENAAQATSNVEALNVPLPYELEAIRDVFAGNNAEKRAVRENEVSDLNRVMAQSAQRQFELDQANERAVEVLLKRVAVNETVIKSQAEIIDRLQKVVDQYEAETRAAHERMQLGSEDILARRHSIADYQAQFRAQYEPPRRPTPDDDGGDDDGGTRQPAPEPDDVADDMARTIANERGPVTKQSHVAPPPTPVLPLVPAAAVRPAEPDLEIPAFLRRNRPNPSETTVEEPPPSATGHAEELFHRTAAVVASAAQHVGAAARGQFGRRAA